MVRSCDADPDKRGRAGRGRGHAAAPAATSAVMTRCRRHEMVSGSRQWRSTWRPTRLVMAAPIACVALLAASCGGTSSQPEVASIGSTNSAGVQRLRPASTSEAAAALAAARCMRTHGMPNFPDPINGYFGFSVGSGINPSSPQFKAAYQYCGTRYLSLGHRSTPAQRAQWNARAVKFSRCMRSHGASDFPDPDGQGAINLPTASYRNTPKVQRAEGACKSLFVGQGFVLVVPVPVP